MIYSHLSLSAQMVDGVGFSPTELVRVGRLLEELLTCANLAVVYIDKALTQPGL